MTKLKTPLFSLLAFGKLGPISIRRRDAQSIAEKTPVVPDAKSLAQLSWRHMYQKAIALWHALSPQEKQEWESLARPKHMTGYAWFISQALKPNPGLYLPLQGGTMQGDIDMAKHVISHLPEPTDDQEPATKAYADALTGELPKEHWRRLNMYHFSHYQGIATSTVFTADYIHACPFSAPVACTIARIGLRVASGAAGTAHLGIYLDNGLVYPGTLLSDCGTIDVSTSGDKVILGLSINIGPGELYWLAYLANSSPTLYYPQVYCSWDLIGSSAPYIGLLAGTWYKDQPYGNLPDTFPANAWMTGSNTPNIGVYLT